MKTPPPTLADSCIALALDKRRAGGRGPENENMRSLLLRVASARKFVLDHDMSAYLCDMSRGFWRGGLRQRICMLENARRMARLPHPLTWIEFDYPAYIERGKLQHGLNILRPGAAPDERFPARVGWLLAQHPRIETAFIATEVSSSMLHPGLAAPPHPVSVAWCSDDAPLPWRAIKLWKDEPDAEYIAMMSGYRSTQVAWTFTYTEAMSAGIMRAIEKNARLTIKPSLLVRDLWALLATLNDLPVTMEHVEPSKGYVARGSYRRFLTHKVIHLSVPETRWRKLVIKTAIALRRRAHQVRGHWRDDWRRPPARICQHDWNEEMVCRLCGGHKLWISEHARGDASLGFVTHDYEVSRAP